MPGSEPLFRTPAASISRQRRREHGNLTGSGSHGGGSRSNSNSNSSISRPLLSGTTYSHERGGHSGRSKAKSTVTSRTPPSTGRSTRSHVQQRSRKKQIVYPPAAQSVQSFVSSDTDIFSVSEMPELDLDHMAIDERMTMREAAPVRPIFPSEEASSKNGGIATTTPEVVIAPTQLQSKQQLMSDDDLDAVGDFIIRGSAVGFCLWIFLMINVYVVAPADSYEMISGGERQATWTIVILLFATNTTRIIPLAFQKNGFQFLKSGIVVGSFTVQFIAIVSNWITVAFPTPVMIDPITGMRIHLLRFAVWTPLCFLMTFLTEAIDLNWQSKASAHESFQQHSYQVAWWHAGFMAISCMAGVVFPFCDNFFVWWEVMILSWVFYATIYVRLYQRYKRYQLLSKQQMSQTPNNSRTTTRGPNFLLNEAVDRAKMSFQLILLCSITWTLIALNFTICCFLPKFVAKDSVLASPELQFVIGTGLEAISKVYYLTMQLHVYEKVFDESARSARRLEEMRTLMSALWEASTDILVICAETDDFIHAVISPHPLLQSEVELEELCDGGRSSSSTMLEISKMDNSFVSFPMNLSDPVTRKDAQRIQTQRQRTRDLNMDFNERDTARGTNLATLARVAKQACMDPENWGENDVNWSLQEMLEYDPETEQDIPVTCEAKATAIESGGVLLVLRNVSERYQRFEVEKALLEEVIVRKKDAEAIRFTRHEVKNGLLAAIGIVDGLKEQMQLSQGGDDKDSHMDDLDAALKEILESILDNAMIREVVYEGYVPRRKSLDLTELLDSKQRERSACGGAKAAGAKRQFPLFATPEPFPHLLLDPQLIRKIYQNAVSNACKYGKKDGDVKTFLTYDAGSHIFRMEVFNLPGFKHGELLRLSEDETDSVFRESTQLQINQRLDTKEGRLVSARSAGDGAWIMQKCAECLGGSCEIAYKTGGTTLTFECPATISEEWMTLQQRSKSHVPENFAIPPSTWAIAVEDSPIQQKLLNRFLKQTGFADEKTVILGKTAEEIYNFTDTIRELMLDNPTDKFVLIIDENLDIVEGGTVTSTVSGSFSIHQLRKSLAGADEDRMLSLIRSANDSVEEVEMYQSRAHGFLLKGPMKKGGLLEEIKPWWMRRFDGNETRKTKRRAKTRNEKREIVRTPSGSGRTMLSYSESENYDVDDWTCTKDRITDLVSSIDTLCGFRPGMENAEADWQSVRYKLLLLNIDLKINGSRDRLALAASAVDALTCCADTPDDLANSWLEIRDLVVKGIRDDLDDDESQV